LRMRLGKCTGCGRYTLKDACTICGKPAKNCEPAKYSPQDPYGRYRRKMKEEIVDG